MGHHVRDGELTGGVGQCPEGGAVDDDLRITDPRFAPLHRTMDQLESQLGEDVFRSNEAREGLAAFAEKREPRFRP